LVMVIVGSAWAQGGSADKGKALVESNKCALCHKAPEPGKPVLGKPMEMLAGTHNDAQLKKILTDPKSIDPKIKMPAYKFSDEQLKDVTAYLKSIAKH